MAFDIRDALTGRSYPTAQTNIWITDEVFYKIDNLKAEMADLADMAKNEKKYKALKDELEALLKERDETAYVLHLRGISNRSNEDILSRSMARVPIQRDMFGREKDELTFQRNQLIRESQLAAHITKLVDPDGNEQVINEENRVDVARAILAEAPPVTLAIIDQAIVQINKDFKDQQALHQSTDFLSKR